ncbi:MAG: gliding motility-associated C-terminal domain-containing protein [Bacteroidota bacterium]|nr:gliding motility-associated C-terminal domain-containing protein [Bacteroidota bacterium]
MKSIFIILFFTFYLFANCQVISPQVINSAGSQRALGNTSITIEDNVGETFIETITNGNFIVTQGFLQPEIAGTLKPTDSYIKSDVSCKDKSDGYISVSVSNAPSTYTIQWQPSSVCPANNCSYVDSLKAGTYKYKVFVSVLTPTGTIIDSTSIPLRTIIINGSNEPCKVKTFNAITPNGDGNNDTFVIDNITEFPKNRVTIYNRWGIQLSDIYGYDNVTKYWPTIDESNKLLSTTYFYIIDLGDGGVLIKGWVEVLKN